MNKIIIVLFVFALSQIQAQTLTGPLEVCQTECHQYQISYEADFIFWEVTGGELLENRGEIVDICWQEDAPEGSIVIKALEDGTLIELINEKVNINDLPNTKIIFPPYPLCATNDTIRDQEEFIAVDLCKKVCPGSQVLYRSVDGGDQSHDWKVEGDLSNSINGNNLLVEWPETGEGSIALILANEDGCRDSISYCIEVLERPEITIDRLNGSQGDTEFCKGQSIQLNANSIDALTYLWEVAGQSFEGAQLDYTFEQSGTIAINLISTTECFCQDTTTLTFTIIDTPGPIIDCIGTVCQGEETTYTTNSICQSYQWIVSSEGSIIDGGSNDDNFVTVQWNGGAYGNISLQALGCDDNVCNTPTEVSIPIMSASTTIFGPDEVCKEGKSKYYVPNFAGANYTWKITGNGYISEGWGTNEIEVTWQTEAFQPNESLIEVSIDNCFLECESVAQLQVQLKPRFAISGDPYRCENSLAYLNAFESWNGVNVDWYVTTPDGTELELDKDISYLPTGFELIYGTGEYVFTIRNNSGDYCNTEASTTLIVREVPPVPTLISAPTEICAGEAYIYEVASLGSQYEYVWSIRNGTDYSFFYGEKVILEWGNASARTLSVYIQDTESFCRSEELMLEMTPIANAELEGINEICLDEIGQYNLSDIFAKDVEWSVMPSDAGTIALTDEEYLQVHWHRAGNQILEAKYCGKSYVLNVNVLSPEEPTLDKPDGICPGENAVVNLNGGPGSSFRIYDGEDFFVGDSNPVNLGSGFYFVEYIDRNGCTGSFNFYIDTYEIPDVSLTSLDYGNICRPGGTATLEALTTNGGLSYEWFHNGNQVGTNDPKYVAGEEGSFGVEVTNKEGCTNNDFVVVTCIESECSCRSDGGTRYFATQGSCCNEYSFTNSSFDYVPGTLVYDFGDPDSGANNISTDENPTHVFTKAGHFVVILRGQVPSINIPDDVCAATFVDYVTVEAAADFDYIPSCTGDPMQFKELVSFLPDYSIVDYAWNFGDPASGLSNTSNDKDPSHAFTSSGSFDVQLTVTMNTGCQAKITKNVIVEESSDVFLELPLSFCAEEGLIFKALSDDLVGYTWDFGDPASGFANTSKSEEAIHKYLTLGLKTISVTAENVFGCKTTVTEIIDISVNQLTGEISADKAMPLCEGETTILSAPSGGIAYLWSNGESTSEIVVGEADIYRVTVTGANTCSYETESFIVNTIKPINPIIRAFKPKENSFESDVFNGSIEVCQGESFTLRTNWFNSASYSWSTGSTNYQVPFSQLSSLGVGEHWITLTVTEANYNCEIEAEPFKVVVYPRPEIINIVSDQTTVCEGINHTLFVDQPDSDLVYYWNTGERGTSINTSVAGNYFVEGINEFGCSAFSNWIAIRPLPDTDGFVAGCHEVCFPYDLCVSNANSLASIRWYKDGIEVSGSSGSSFVFSATEAGDYSAILTNTWGCESVTDVLSLSPEPMDLKLNGIVYLDDNEDGVYDSGDQLLENITVRVISGNTIIQETQTNSNGEYLFDPLETSNAMIVVDPTGFDIDVDKSILNFEFDIKSCNEEEEQNFPLVLGCLKTSNLLETYTCIGSAVELNGNWYDVGERDTLILANAKGCDSLVITEVFGFELPQVSLVPLESCENQNNGSLTVEAISGGNYEYSIDGINYSPATTFFDLAPDSYTLYIIDSNGCEQAEQFVINELTSDNIDLQILPNCDEEYPANIILEGLDPSTTQIALDDPTQVVNGVSIDEVGPGSHTLWITLANGCTIEEPFNVEPYTTPTVIFLTTKSCREEANGTLILGSSNTAGLTYSLENDGNFSEVSEIDQLEPGEYVLYAEDEFGCAYQYSFEIEAVEEPIIDLMMTSSCEDTPTGTVEIVSTDNNQYSINGSTYSNTLTYNGLGAGTHEVSVLSEEDCEFIIPFTIDAIIQPNVELTISNTCIDESSGSVEIESNSVGLMTSLDGLNFAEQSNFEGLAEGEHVLYYRSMEGCDYMTSFNIEPILVPDFTISATNTCLGESSGSIEISTEVQDVLCSIDGVTFTDQFSFEGLANGTYMIYIKGKEGCIQTREIDVLENPDLEVEFNNVIIECDTEVLELGMLPNNISNGLDYTWSTGARDSILMVRESGEYTIEVQDQCTSVFHTWNIEFPEEEEQATVFVPNVFLPGALDENGIFKPQTKDGLIPVKFDFKIMDRWGNKVFSCDDPMVGWDGTYNGKELEIGVYVWLYTIEIEDCKETKVLKEYGDVTLIR